MHRDGSAERWQKEVFVSAECIWEKMFLFPGNSPNVAFLLKEGHKRDSVISFPYGNKPLKEIVLLCFFGGGAGQVKQWEYYAYFTDNETEVWESICSRS